MLQSFHKGYVSGKKDQSIFDDKEELKLLLEIVDIVDELKMIRNLIVLQRSLLRDFVWALRKFRPSNEAPEIPTTSYNVNFHKCTVQTGGAMTVDIRNSRESDKGVENTKILAQGISAPASQNVVDADETLAAVIAEMDATKSDSEYTHKMVRLEWLDIMQSSELTLFTVARFAGSQEHCS
jgi:hypothetical protein